MRCSFCTVLLVAGGLLAGPVSSAWAWFSPAAAAAAGARTPIGYGFNGAQPVSYGYVPLHERVASRYSVQDAPLMDHGEYESIPPGAPGPATTGETYETVPWDGPMYGHEDFGDGDCRGAHGCSHGGGCFGECGCGNDCHCRPSCFNWPQLPWDQLSVFGGVHGFKGPLNLGRDGSFGFHEGFNLGLPLGGMTQCYGLGG